MKAVHLGFELQSGNPVEIPVAHMCVTGQTQRAGKTSTLEALIARSGLRAVTFITKRGEGSFTHARRLAPYFREQADWQFVAAILEASRGEKLKFERAWIIRASKGARTLADVHRNVKHALETAKGLSADVYLTLDAYLEVIVPEIARVDWAPALHLQPGVNAVDLTALSVELQHLVIRSTLAWVLDKEESTVVVVPEAWKFIPQGRGTPVKLTAEAFIRQGAALRNYLWLDSQDVGGIEKTILRSVPVWLLGVQRESNEIDRTLDNIPAGVRKPSKADIATLGLGEFYACWGTHVRKTYVQPAWLEGPHAQAIATGVTDKATAVAPRVARKEWDGVYVDEDTGRLRRFEGAVQEADVTTEEAARLTRENVELKAKNEQLSRRLAALERASGPARRVPDATKTAIDRAERQVVEHVPGATWPPLAVGAGQTGETVTVEAFTPAFERLYDAIKARLIAEAPALVRIAVAKPEVEIAVTRPVLMFDEHSMKWRLMRLAADGFFAERRGPSAIRSALKRTGPDANAANIARAMDDLVKAGVFTDEGSGYQAVEGVVCRIREV